MKGIIIVSMSSRRRFLFTFFALFFFFQSPELFLLLLITIETWFSICLKPVGPHNFVILTRTSQMSLYLQIHHLLLHVLFLLSSLLPSDDLVFVVLPFLTTLPHNVPSTVYNISFVSFHQTGLTCHCFTFLLSFPFSCSTFCFSAVLRSSYTAS